MTLSMTWPFFNVIVITFKLVTHYYNNQTFNVFYMLLLARFMLNIKCCMLHIYFCIYEFNCLILLVGI